MKTNAKSLLRIGTDTPGRAIVEIFRVAAGKVVKHWDVIQDIPHDSANTNGMF